MLLQRLFFLNCIILLLIGCRPQQSVSCSSVSDNIQKATGFTLQKKARPRINVLPPNVVERDGLAEEEAVSIALWNNAQFQADLASISQVSGADF